MNKEFLQENSWFRRENKLQAGKGLASELLLQQKVFGEFGSGPYQSRVKSFESVGPSGKIKDKKNKLNIVKSQGWRLEKSL